MIAQALIGLLTVYCISLLSQFLRNVRLAKKTGLPYICLPVSEFNILVLTIFGLEAIPNFINTWLPGWLADIVYDNAVNCRWTVRDRRAKKLGQVSLVVTPTTLSCNVADAAVVSQVCTERGMFPKPVWQYEVLELYGPNVLTCEDKQWAHHRRHTATTFNESNNKLVWRISIQQALEMIAQWEQKYKHSSSDRQLIIPAAKSDILKLTLNVICGAGFGVSLPFKPNSGAAATNDLASLLRDSDSPPQGAHFTFCSVIEYMNSCLNTVILANMVIPKWIPRMTMPFFKNDFFAFEDFQHYLQALVDGAKAEKNQDRTHDLLQGIVQSQQKDDGLTDSEIIGNLHILTVAGHETTATTLRFALVLLAMHPDIQDWLQVSLDETLKSQPSDPKDWDYTTLFPKLIAPLCIMLETLRLYPPVVTVPKWTASNPVPITHQQQTYTLPPNVNINLNANALHYSPEYWGPDAASFSPRRWDKSNADSFLAPNDGKTGLAGPGLEFDTIHRPVRGAFIPFSDGFRACVGKRFAQVEFVAVLAILFSRYRVSLGKMDARESEEVVYRRAEKVLNESVTVLTLGMRRDVPLVFEQRNL
ncbi:putative cytochrome P450 monooxygenase [Aspergillus steynii IBT 23096]|uniref:Putative cytochrome P450 monooxygenase n=1 Tax=Aspergillus steynii IBT 23096 TaxID=1392250 RepID=A0A2I2GH57_9EURO|nr:putative cytochrome P450 monooxygenase [Aspergillus steynii IBT 23096]PLB52213.1 putative cytochrome P450 monooxygenase [Aspergillus steynii IBT 23096]